MAANTIKELDGVLESFTGASLSQLVGRYLNGGDGRARETPAKADDTSGEREGQP
jgi:hypothetical protein